MTHFEIISYFIIVFGAVVTACGIVMAFMKFKEQMKAERGEVGSFEGPAWLAVVIVGAGVIYLGTNFYSNGGSPGKVTFLSPISLAYAQNVKAAKDAVSGWSYLGEQDSQSRWSFRIKMGSDQIKNFDDLRMALASKDRKQLTGIAVSNVNIRENHFSSLHGTILSFLAGPEPAIKGSLARGDCVEVSAFSVVGVGKGWIEVKKSACKATPPQN